MAAARRLRGLLAQGNLLQMPCCYDALSARLIEQAGFPLTFVSGFGAAAARGLPDTGLMSFGEMRDTMCSIAEALEATPRKIPCIGDGDTGYGNSVNAKRTVAAYAQAGMAGIMIEDQVRRSTLPAVQKRGECSHDWGGAATF
jgi:2-methylisocitrate lyase-like PEP mutase family enzyme